MPVTDEELYHQYLDGDDAGLTALMEKYGNALTLYIDGYLGDIHEAEDLMIDVFAYLLAKRPRIRAGGFKPYLYKSARNRALRHKSRRRAVFSLEAMAQEPEGAHLIEDVVKNKERNQILHACLDRLKMKNASPPSKAALRDGNAKNACVRNGCWRLPAPALR